MPGLFVLTIVLFIIALVCVGLWRLLKPVVEPERPDRDDYDKTNDDDWEAARLAYNAAVSRNEHTSASASRGLGVTAIVAASLCAICLFFSCYNPVGTKEVGIETSFNKPVGHLSNGFHLTAPWIVVHEMDAAIQTDTFSNGKRQSGACTSVRIANQQTGCATVSIQWRINQLQQQVALTRIAKQQEETNAAQARANSKLAKSIDKSPNVIVSKCFDLLSQMEKDHETIPAGFYCWPGGSNVGVIAGAK